MPSQQYRVAVLADRYGHLPAADPGDGFDLVGDPSCRSPFTAMAGPTALNQPRWGQYPVATGTAGVTR
jgi:hypothetical protein